jgi:hypothetical protein
MINLMATATVPLDSALVDVPQHGLRLIPHRSAECTGEQQCDSYRIHDDTRNMCPMAKAIINTAVL